MSTARNEAIPAAMRAEIETRLSAIAAAHDVRLLFAVESGSRAWGFPSPDSDYDVRFVYVRRRDQYLRFTPPRDVIETPIADDIDLNGWDIRKALALLLKSNAVVGEWIASPIRYLSDDPVVARIAALADQVLRPHALAHHYASLGRHAAERWLDGDGPVPVKKYFYALRPALAIRSLRRDPGRRPPMDLPALIAAADVPRDLIEPIGTLVAAKRRTNERGNAARVPALDRLIRDELNGAAQIARRDHDATAQAEAEAIFLELVNP